MFKKILVAIDCSSEASKIFNYALSLAQAEKSEILLVHFINWQQHLCSSTNRTPYNSNASVLPIKDINFEPLLREEVEIINEWLHIFIEKARRSNIICKAECHLGNCHSGISDLAKDWNADLVVMGHENYRTSSKILLDSVSKYVMDCVSCPVLTVQESKSLKSNNFAVARNAHSCLVEKSK